MIGEESPAIILRCLAYGEADAVVLALLADGQKASFFARGMRKSQKRFAGGLSVGMTCGLNYTRRQHGLWSLTQSRVLFAFENILDYQQLVFLHFMAEFLQAVLPEGVCEPRAYQLYSDWLKGRNDFWPAATCHTFMQLYSVLGFLALVCHRCQHPVALQNYFWLAKKLYCATCGPNLGQNISMMVSSKREEVWQMLAQLLLFASGVVERHLFSLDACLNVIKQATAEPAQASCIKSQIMV